MVQIKLYNKTFDANVKKQFQVIAQETFCLSKNK